jgi:hypothetical protein
MALLTERTCAISFMSHNRLFPQLARLVVLKLDRVHSAGGVRAFDHRPTRTNDRVVAADLEIVHWTVLILLE